MTDTKRVYRADESIEERQTTGESFVRPLAVRASIHFHQETDRVEFCFV